MKTSAYLFMLLLFSCGQASNKPSSNAEASKPEERQTYRLFECGSDSFKFVLEENTALDSNAFVLKILTRNDVLVKCQILDVRPHASRINYCNDKYAAIGFSCGGPCYSRVFVFTNKDKKQKQFGYPKAVAGNLDVIVSVKDETFQNYIIHNLETGKELNIRIKDINPHLYGDMDSLYMQQNNLVLEYSDMSDLAKKKIVNLDKIMN